MEKVKNSKFIDKLFWLNGFLSYIAKVKKYNSIVKY